MRGDNWGAAALRKIECVAIAADRMAPFTPRRDGHLRYCGAGCCCRTGRLRTARIILTCGAHQEHCGISPPRLPCFGPLEQLPHAPCRTECAPKLPVGLRKGISIVESAQGYVVENGGVKGVELAQLV